MIVKKMVIAQKIGGFVRGCGPKKWVWVAGSLGAIRVAAGDRPAARPGEVNGYGTGMESCAADHPGRWGMSGGLVTLRAGLNGSG
jgi:hypothetical protein